MNANWVKSYWKNHRDTLVEKALRNCHAKGVDSIVFDDTPEARIRLFVANTNHQLWCNNFLKSSRESPMAVGYHPHHCDLTLHVVHGEIGNIIASPERSSLGSLDVSKFRYESAITGDKCAFKMEVERAFLTIKSFHDLRAGQSFWMSASTLHTIAVNSSSQAAWFVYEGKEDPQYQNVCYSNSRLDKFEAKGMYEPMTEEQVLSTLRVAFPDL